MSVYDYAQRGPARADTCPDCGAPVLAFHTGVFPMPVRLDDHDLPVTADLAELCFENRLWCWLGPHIGWSPHYLPVRDWRPIRARHRCAHKHHPQPRGGEQQHQNQHEKETA